MGSLINDYRRLALLDFSEALSAKEKDAVTAYLKTMFTLFASVIAIFMTLPAFAHGVGDSLGEVMG